MYVCVCVPVCVHFPFSASFPAGECLNPIIPLGVPIPIPTGRHHVVSQASTTTHSHLLQQHTVASRLPVAILGFIRHNGLPNTTWYMAPLCLEHFGSLSLSQPVSMSFPSCYFHDGQTYSLSVCTYVHPGLHCCVHCPVQMSATASCTPDTCHLFSQRCLSLSACPVVQVV